MGSADSISAVLGIMSSISVGVGTSMGLATVIGYNIVPEIAIFDRFATAGEENRSDSTDEEIRLSTVMPEYRAIESAPHDRTAIAE
jgi:hypothetical protein